MTNGEKFKTADERDRAFVKYCMRFVRNGCDGCFLKGSHTSCRYRWLELEAEDEKPLPCPFCGHEVFVSDSNRCLICVCGYSSTVDRNLSKVIAAHNCVAKAVKESEVANGND